MGTTKGKIKQEGKNIRVSDDHHKAAKLKATEKGKTIKEYVEELIAKDK